MKAAGLLGAWEIWCYVNIKNPHPKVEVFPNLNVDNVDNLFSEKMLPDIYDISGSHSYQQVTVHTTF